MSKSDVVSSLRLRYSLTTAEAVAIVNVSAESLGDTAENLLVHAKQKLIAAIRELAVQMAAQHI